MIFGTIWYLPTVIADYDFDKKAGLNTSVVYFGMERIFSFYRILLVLLAICAIGVLVLDYDFTFKLFAALLLLLLPFIVYLIIKDRFIDYFHRVDFYRYYCIPAFVLCAIYLFIATVRYNI